MDVREQIFKSDAFISTLEKVKKKCEDGSTQIDAIEAVLSEDSTLFESVEERAKTDDRIEMLTKLLKARGLKNEWRGLVSTIEPSPQLRWYIWSSNLVHNDQNIVPNEITSRNVVLFGWFGKALWRYGIDHLLYEETLRKSISCLSATDISSEVELLRCVPFICAAADTKVDIWPHLPSLLKEFNTKMGECNVSNVWSITSDSIERNESVERICEMLLSVGLVGFLRREAIMTLWDSAISEGFNIFEKAVAYVLDNVSSPQLYETKSLEDTFASESFPLESLDMNEFLNVKVEKTEEEDHSRSTPIEEEVDPIDDEERMKYILQCIEQQFSVVRTIACGSDEEWKSLCVRVQLEEEDLIFAVHKVLGKKAIPDDLKKLSAKKRKNAEAKIEKQILAREAQRKSKSKRRR